jgi:phage terminase small subunit
MSSGGALNEYGLTVKRESFVRHLVENGGNKKQAAIDAGYPEGSAGPRASECLQCPKVQARIETLLREYMSGECAPIAVAALKQLAVSSSSDTVRAAAASSLLDRTGYKVPVVVQLEDHRTQADVDKDLAVLLGLDALGDPAGDDKAPVH